jgi:hypothetical protein
MLLSEWHPLRQKLAQILVQTLCSGYSGPIPAPISGLHKLYK